MKKLYQKYKMGEAGKKGFSLVELVIVIAIMAILIAILVPQFIKYVERSRVAKDETNADEILRAVQIAMADESTINGVMDGATVVYTSGSVVLTGFTQAFVDEVTRGLNLANITVANGAVTPPTNASVGTITNANLNLVSRAHGITVAAGGSGTTYTITVTIANALTPQVAITVRGVWS